LNIINLFKIKYQHSVLDELFYTDVYTRVEFGRGAISEQVFFLKTASK